MNVKLLLGITLFVIGLLAGIGGIAGVGRDDARESPTIVEENRSLSLEGDSSRLLAWMAGLFLAAGGVLIGLSMGNFKHPRSHMEPGDEVVNPEGHQKMKHV